MGPAALFRVGLVFNLLALWVAPCARGESIAEDFLHEQMLNNVVAITVSVPGMVNRAGMGFVIGRYGDTLWVATARHVVAVSEGSSDLLPASAITVHRRGDRTIWTLNAMPWAYQGDIAFLPVNMPLAQAVMDSFDVAAIATEPQIGEQVWVAGKVAEIDYDAGSARVTAISSSGVPSIAGTVADPGQSGSPVVLSRGIIGMLVGTTGEVTIVPIEAIHAQATIGNLPWKLIDSGIPPPVPTRACVVASGLSEVSLGLNGPHGVTRFGSDGCATAIAGKARLVIFDRGVSCVPMDLNLTREAQQTLRVLCSTSPEGMWQSATAGYLNVSAGNENEWQVSGLDVLSPHGTFQGTLHGIPPNLSIDARAADGALLQGPLQLDPTSLKGRALLNGMPVDIEFHR